MTLVNRVQAGLELLIFSFLHFLSAETPGVSHQAWLLCVTFCLVRVLEGRAEAQPRWPEVTALSSSRVALI